MSHQFPKQHRLLSKPAFKAVFDRSCSLRGRAFRLIYRYQNRGYARVGIVVTKRNARLAVQRNQIKRVVRESYRTLSDQLPDVDVVVIGYHQCTSMNRKELRQCIDVLWQRLIKASKEHSKA